MAGGDGLNQFQQLLAASKRGLAVVTVTLVDAPVEEAALVGQMLIVYPDGTASGCLVNREITRQAVEAATKNEWKKPFLQDIFSEETGTYRLFFDRLTKNYEAVVFGGGHISQPLVEILGLLDFQVTVVDDRPQFANTQRFPKARQVLCTDFTAAVEEGLVQIGRHTAVIVITRGHQHDLDCLRVLIDKGAGYLGMIGSRRRIIGILDLLRSEGAKEEELSQVYAPIGLNIGAQTPAEIAVSIAAEIVAAFRGGNGRPLSQRQEGSING
ncbi:MAG: putative sulfurylase large subunit, molybdopterin cytosine dinucleotide biosynthesis [Firmicutes bacterium]|nr:putative sulfurylase large subunit, molybdopterin cytosine dinucleotide biosynthesis [Bacillota bacterium]